MCRKWVDVNDASLFYLPVVIACAVRLGFGAALFAAATCFVSWDYFFLAPYHTLEVDSQRSWVAMVVFVVTAVITSSLAARVRRQVFQAEARERNLSTLLRASQLVSQGVESDDILANLVIEVKVSSGAPVACIFEKEALKGQTVLISMSGNLDAIETITKSAERFLERAENAGDSIGYFRDDLGVYFPILHEGICIGVIFIGCNDDSAAMSKSDERLIQTLAAQVGTVIAREQASERARVQIRQAAILDERRRMAQEVHDSLSNTFNSIKFILEAANRGHTKDATEDCLNAALALAVEGAKEARRSVFALRPVAFDDSANLADAIRHLANLSRPNCEIIVTVDAPEPMPLLLEDAEDHIFRIAQEAVANALRHASASLVKISLSYMHNLVILDVLDNGLGFNKGGESYSGFGITNMHNRASTIGAELTIESTENQGTSVGLSMPISNSDNINHPPKMAHLK